MKPLLKKSPCAVAGKPLTTMTWRTWLMTLMTLITLASQAQADVIRVRFESELPGMQNSSATFTTMGIETFDRRGLGVRNFDSNFDSAGAYSGRYTGLQVNAADQYGGANGNGRYAATFGSYALDLSSSPGVTLNYFGFWLSALDANNFVDFYRSGELLLTFTPADLLSMVPSNSRYYGNPTSAFKGKNGGEPYAFVNFFNETGTFDRIIFRQAGGGGYESDNHTVGEWRTQGSGTEAGVYGLPEPGTLLLAGAAFLIAAGVRRRSAVQSARSKR